MDMNDIKKIVSNLTLEEKAGLCSGEDFWHTKAVERLGVESVMVADGPHGLRKQAVEPDHLGQNGSIKAVCFPAASATACSFDRELLRNLGEVLGDECQAEEVAVLLGPAVNIKRSPLCGRNFEYFSEDPLLTGELSASYINGVQSRNIGTSIKHFATNNQEFNRLTCSSNMDMQTLREIYLTAFEIAVKKSMPWTVMCSYNLLNGEQVSESSLLMNDILRDEWGYDGYVMSDWGAVNDRVKGLAAGLDLEMPSSNGTTDKEIVKAVKAGVLDEKIVDNAVERILRINYKYLDNKKTLPYDMESHHMLAAKFEEECAVLLKNDNILPLSEDKKIVFIGGYAEKPRFQGGGSSNVNTFKVTSILDVLDNEGNKNITYEMGFSPDEDIYDDSLAEKAITAAGEADVAVIFAGLPDAFESEGYDRKHMRLPDCQLKLIDEIVKVQKNVVVVLHNGSPVEMPFADNVSGILEMYLGGQGVGISAYNILFGKTNPSGKLAESFPKRLEDNPSYINFPGDGNNVNYGEGIFVGYRYYDKKKMEVLFPFGHGLSYTEFQYSDLRIDGKTVSLKVKNVGKMAGKEAVQLYISDKTGKMHRPEKELRDFIKIALQIGEEKEVKFELHERMFSWYNTEFSRWCANSGKYEIMIGSSSRDIRLTAEIDYVSESEPPIVVTPNTYIDDLINNEKTSERVLKELHDIYIRSNTKIDLGEIKNETLTKEQGLRFGIASPIRSMRSFCGVSHDDMMGLINNMNDFLKL